ncbi:uncharacterized protein LOC127260299 [Andrographis paniculata]|uniref:uncharacterized protein LOC127260299 n=1 Tax=Andrographis paniculata TaxID=175694 RepID=UPI0021E7BB60|nr:uncharacterized protein LOC127260299 [Andrographis paniculata]
MERRLRDGVKPVIAHLIPPIVLSTSFGSRQPMPMPMPMLPTWEKNICKVGGSFDWGKAIIKELHHAAWMTKNVIAAVPCWPLIQSNRLTRSIAAALLTVMLKFMLS